MNQLRSRGRARLILSLAAICCLPLLACEETTEPAFVSSISRVSGDGQYSKKGTPLAEPVIVRVTLSDGRAAQGQAVIFSVTGGGGSVSETRVLADDLGWAATNWTLGPDVGENNLRATVESNSSLKPAVFTATGADFFCPEEDPTFVQKHFPTGNLFLFTRRSSLNKENGDFVAGVVRLSFNSGYAVASSFKKLPDDGSITVVTRDCAFSAAGDFYLALGDIDDFVTKVAPNGVLSTFSALEDPLGAEIAISPTGILVGCDSYGPFFVTCHSPLGRFDPEAFYAGTPADRANNDAVAVDPLTEDIYFIHLPDFQLLRLPVDSLTATGPTELVTQLTRDEAEGAKGMVVNDDDQNVFILVESDAVKAILRVTPAGNKTVEYDFFDRGAGAAAGVQNDLAISQVGTGSLFTIDTLNDMLIGYDISQQTLYQLPPHPTLSDPESISAADGLGGERVGLAVLP